MTAREIKPNLGRLVVHVPSGVLYRLTGAIIRRDAAGSFWYQAELQDLTALRSVRICKLEDISPVERKE